MPQLQPVTDQFNFFDLLLAANQNLTTAIGLAREAAGTTQSAEDRVRLQQRAKDEIGCLASHFMSALELIPADAPVSS